jgi:hypothetical protein
VSPPGERAWSFIHVADMHIGSPRSYRFQPAWNDNWETARRQIVALRPDFLIVGGDITRDGATHVGELEGVKADFERLPFPVHTIPGNHEIGNKYSRDSPVAIQSAYLNRYRSVFGDSRWSFEHRGARFTGFNAFLLGSGLPEEQELRSWLEALPGRAEQTERPERSGATVHAIPHVWILHPALFADRVDEPDFNPHTERVPWYFVLDSAERHYVFDVMKRTGATDLITAHIHCRRHVEVDGIRIHFAPSTAFPQWGKRWQDGDETLGFLQFVVEAGTVTPRFVALDSVSKRKGYGPGGNPPVEGRDYGAAWDKPSF